MASEVLDANCEGIDRSRQLLDAANELLAKDGLEGLTVRAVLKRSGLARRAFYERFAGKDDLVIAIFEQTLHEAAHLFREEVAAFADPVEKIRVVVLGLIAGALGGDCDGGDTDHRVAAMAREHLRLAQTRPGKLQASIQPLLDLIAELVTEGIRTGQLRECDPALQATLIFNLVATTLHTALMSKEESLMVPREKLADEMWEFCRRAILA